MFSQFACCQLPNYTENAKFQIRISQNAKNPLGPICTFACQHSQYATCISFLLLSSNIQSSIICLSLSFVFLPSTFPYITVPIAVSLLLVCVSSVYFVVFLLCASGIFLLQSSPALLRLLYVLSRAVRRLRRAAADNWGAPPPLLLICAPPPIIYRRAADAIVAA